MPATTTKSPLAARFGHEEELSRRIATHHMEWLLAQMAATPQGAPSLERHVIEGAPDRKGRLDILQQSDRGMIIVENQYGTSDSAHFVRLDGYARSVPGTYCVVWIAERFRQVDIERAQSLEIGVWCVEVADDADGEVVFTPVFPFPVTRLGAAARLQRIAKARKRFEEKTIRTALQKIVKRDGAICRGWCISNIPRQWNLSAAERLCIESCVDFEERLTAAREDRTLQSVKKAAERLSAQHGRTVAPSEIVFCWLANRAMLISDARRYLARNGSSPERVRANLQACLAANPFTAHLSA
jgi:hypothetical protein